MQSKHLTLCNWVKLNCNTRAQIQFNTLTGSDNSKFILTNYFKWARFQNIQEITPLGKLGKPLHGLLLSQVPTRACLSQRGGFPRLKNCCYLLKSCSLTEVDWLVTAQTPWGNVRSTLQFVAQMNNVLKSAIKFELVEESDQRDVGQLNKKLTR